MDERIKFFVGLDAHKDSTSIGACEAGRDAARFVGTVGPDVHGLLKVLAKAGDPAQVSVVYEAGPTGYGLYRELCRRGYRCEIVAPSLIPRRPGEREMAVVGRRDRDQLDPRIGDHRRGVGDARMGVARVDFVLAARRDGSQRELGHGIHQRRMERHPAQPVTDHCRPDHCRLPRSAVMRVE